MTWNGRDGGQANAPPPTTAEAGAHAEKAMRCVWWDREGVVDWELLLENQTINFNKDSSQLDQLKAALSEKRPELINRK